jgi:O-acetyl-ADP-ribose deacetylase (regulator of RNase III)
MKSTKRCFVIMPFGEKADSGLLIDFDRIYDEMIRPAVEETNLECIRCDQIAEAGSIHRDMFEHICNDEVAVVDITSLNPNVFYELGVRHALCERVTVMIRRKGMTSPFNVSGMRTIEYDPGAPETWSGTRRDIALYIRNGLQRAEGDSPVLEILSDVKIRRKEQRLSEQTCFRYSVTKSPGKEMGLITGDIQRVRNIDIWVNSENTNMQMARFYDRSLSSVIRYLGATRSRLGFIEKDVIADELKDIMGTTQAVPPATVLATASGNLWKTHGVKRVYHAASVIGEFGRGYLPIPNIADCVTRALELAETDTFEGEPLRSILFSAMGAGTGQGDAEAVGSRLLEAALCYLEDCPHSMVRQVFFLVTRPSTLDIWQTVLAGWPHRLTPMAAAADRTAG